MRLDYAAAAAAILMLAACNQGAGGGGGGATGGLSGADRQQFVDGATRSCVSTATQNPNVTAAAVQDYCTCSANAMADKVTPADEAAANADPTKAQQIMTPYATAAAAACRDKLHMPAAP